MKILFRANSCGINLGASALREEWFCDVILHFDTVALAGDFTAGVIVQLEDGFKSNDISDNLSGMFDNR